MCGGSNPRIHVCGFYVCFKNTICSADRYCNSIYRSNSYFRCFYRVRHRCVSYIYGKSCKSIDLCHLFLILQQIEGNLIYPHVVGNSVGLPSIWVLAAVSIGGSLMGIVGMLIFIPIVSVLYALFREIVYLKLKQQQIDPSEIE